MDHYSQLRIFGFDHLEFAVFNLEQSANIFYRLGFERLGYREIPSLQLQSILLGQGKARIVISHSHLKTERVGQFLALHGEGVMTIALSCENAVTALELATSRGAKLTEAPKKVSREFGAIERASIQGVGDVYHTFIHRTGDLFDDGFNDPVRLVPPGFGLEDIDHITLNVQQGKMREWASYYENVFGLKNTRFFDIHTAKTGLYSFVMESPDHLIKMPINEPTEPASQIQEFLNINHGAGVQHVAFSTRNIIESIRKLKSLSTAFLTVPSTYYSEVTARVPLLKEPLSTLQELGILADGDKLGYLLQIFTENLMGPFFLELIQREGNDGFGEGNFQALFEAIERDQEKRGVIKA